MAKRERISFWEAFSIGVGGMIGGGIFAVLGLSIELSKGAAPVAFLLAGLVALTTAYSYARLSVRYPSEGGTIEYLVRAYGSSVLSGGLNVLLLASYIVMIALYAYAFGSYAASVISSSPVVKHALITAVILAFIIVNAYGAVVSGKTEDALVGFKLAVLLLVAGSGMMFIDWSRLSPATWPDGITIVAGGMIIFLAYEGFELIANTAQDVENPSMLPKVFFSAVIVVIAVYVMIALVTVGTLPFDVIIRERDYALSAVAKPTLGNLGFWLVTLAALASTSSAINATLYGTARASYMVAKYGQLPKVVEKRVWKEAFEGLILIGVFSAILANTASLESISTAGSGGFLIVFLAVNLAALLILLYRMIELSPRNLEVLATLIAASFAVEFAYRSLTGRKIEKYVDDRLREREENIRNWESWIGRVVDRVAEKFEDAEVYLVGSVARNEIHKASDVDLLVLTENLPSREEKDRVVAELKEGLTKQHPVHIHFVHSRDRDMALRKARQYRVLRKRED
ncbi:Amino acid transporter [Geoglobus ahangari]|uniref:Amino acid transporter n=1 Tax=Geoglobus ahangari TaxID=113653 RepID=A0A0F7IDG5_9EURY|nr:amino acid permease [Geoglobus ahangari]AKG91470.1 Amino acid transporter [Geoglobus ahangari]